MHTPTGAEAADADRGGGIGSWEIERVVEDRQITEACFVGLDEDAVTVEFAEGVLEIEMLRRDARRSACS
jgi:hypothetical protein